MGKGKVIARGGFAPAGESRARAGCNEEQKWVQLKDERTDNQECLRAM